MYKLPSLRTALVLAIPLLISPFSWAANTVSVYDEVAGRVVVEAEHFASKINDPDGHHYHVVPDDDGKDSFGDTHATDYLNARGGKYIVALSDSGVNHNAANFVSGPPSVDYKVNINTPGIYRLWVRWKGFDGSSDSMYAKIVEIATSEWYQYGAGGVPTDSDFSSTTSGAGWDGIAAPEVVSGGGEEVPAIFTLSGGVYTIRLAMREDGAAIDAILLQLATLPDPTSPGPAESGQASNFIGVTSPPLDTLAALGKTATFTVVANGTGIISYQWQSKAPTATDFSNIAAATAASYVTAPATDAANGTLYRVIIGNGTKTVTSAIAKLITDGTPPTLVQVIGEQGGASVSLIFSESLDLISAQTLANYTVSGLKIVSASLAGDRKSVVLITDKQTPEAAYTVNATGIKDSSGNAMTVAAAGSFHGPTVVAGKVLVRFYKNLGGTSVSDLLNASIYPNGATSAALWDVFSSGESTGDNFGDNYGFLATFSGSVAR